MKKIKYLFFIAIALLTFNSCDDENGFGTDSLDYVTFGDPTYSTGVDIDGSATVDIPVYYAKVTDSDKSFNVIVDGTNAAEGSYEVPTTVVVPSGTNEGTLSVVLSDVNLGIGINSLTVSFEDVAGSFHGDPTTINYFQNCSEVEATLDIVFDGYGSETSWEITDALGGIVASQGAGTYTDGQASATETFNLCAGRDYTFTINDAYGDGLSWPANGTYTLTIGSVVKVTGGGDFGSSESTAFDTK